MEFVKKSGSVTDIVIPEGNVIKIHEKKTGRVLWEKGLRAEKITSGLPNTTLWSCLDTGSNIMFIPYSRPSYFTYNPSTRKFSSLKKMKSYDYSLYGIDIDPVSKIWLATVDARGRDPDNLNNYVETIRLENSQGKLSNAGGSGETSPQWGPCCWMKHLNAFCVIGGGSSCLISLQHTIVSTGNNCIPYNVTNDRYSFQNQICYSDTLRTAVIITYPGNLTTIKTFASSDGVSWKESSDVIDDYNSGDGGSIFWVSDMNSFILFAHGKKEKGDYHYCDIYKSRDGLKWEKIGTGPDLERGYSGAYSPTEKIFLFVGRQKMAITKDFTKWTKVSSPVSRFDNRCKAIWSKTANAFIITPVQDNVGFLQITFEK